MKKVLSILSMFLFLISFNAIGQNNYQLPNNTFESWSNPSMSSTTQIPTGWHSFSEAEGTWSSLSNTNYSGPRLGHGGTGYCCMIKSHKVWAVLTNINANGTATTGQMIINATSTSSNDNYVLSDINNSYGHNARYSFSGRPDSVKLYAKFKRTSTEYGSNMSSHREFNASLNIIIHKSGVTYEDRPNDAENGYKNGLIAKKQCLLPSPNNSTSAYETDWTLFAFKLNYFTTSGVLTATPTLSNTDEPGYLLANCATSKNVGYGHYGDELWLDDIWLVYNKQLANLVVGNTTLSSNSSELLSLNSSAYSLANGATTNTFTGSIAESSYPTYTYSTPVCSSDLEDINITPTAQSGFAIVSITRPPTVANPYALVKVTHTDNSYYYFRIHFSNVVSVNQPTITGNTSACNNSSVTLTASSTTTGASYKWYNSNNVEVSDNATYSPSFSGVNSATSYTYTCKALKDGCYSEAASHSVTVNPQPNVTLNNGGVYSVCEGETVTVTASGANSYAWSDGLGSGATVHPTAAGTYTVTGTSIAGCTNTATATVTMNTRPTVTLVADVETVCAPSTITLTADGADTYSWTGVTGNNNTATVSATGTNTVTVTGTNTTTNCSNTATITVVVYPLPIVTLTPSATAVCYPNTITLTAGGATSYSWSGATAENNTATISGIGNYSVTVTGTDDNGCSNTASQSVAVNAVPDAPVTTSASICGTGQVELSASGIGGTCYWYASESTNDILTSGDTYTPTLNTTGTMTYYVAVVSAAGCPSTRTSVTATAYDIPSEPSVSNISHCGPGTFTLTATAPAGASLQWFSDNQAAEPIDNLTVSPETTTSYYVRSDNGQCHSSLSTVTITINDIPAAPGNITSSPVCGSGSSQLSATPAAGCQINWYAVKDFSVQALSQGNPYSTTQLSESRKYYLLSRNNNTGCVSDWDSVTVVVSPIPSLPTVQNSTLCAMGEVTLTGTPGDGGTTLKWYREDGTYLATGNSYTVTVTNAITNFKVSSYNETIGCEGDKIPVSVTVSATIPAPEVSSLVYACGGSATLTANAGSGATLQWYDASDNELPYNTPNMEVSNITASTLYKVSAKVGNCESAKSTVTVEPAAIPALPTASDVSRCGAGEVTLAASVEAGMACRWYVDNSTTDVLSSASPYTTTINATTTFYVAAINDTTQCVSGRQPVQAVVKTLPVTPTTAPAAYCGAGTYTLSANANGNTEGGFHWYSDADGNQEIQNPVEISTGATYYVAWTDNQPCRSALAQLVVTINAIPEMPTATAPDPFCRSGNSAVSVSLSAQPGNNGDACLWYNANQQNPVQQYNYGGNMSASTTYYVSTLNTSTGCESELLAIPVVINTIPAQITVGNQSRCGEGTVTFSATTTAPVTLRWYSANDELLATGGSFTTESLSATTTYKVSTVDTSTGCESAMSTITATVHPAVDAPNASTPLTLCGAGNTTLTATTTQGNSLRWFADANGEQSLESNADGSYTTPTLAVGETYTCYVGAYNNNCSGPLTPVTVHVYAVPELTTLTNDEICGAGDAQLSAATVDGAEVRWYTTAEATEYQTGTSLNLPGINATTVRYAQAVDANTGCQSARQAVTAFVYEIYQADTNATACDNFVWHGKPAFTQSGDYVDTLSSVHGCDSIVTLHLTLNQTKRTSVDSTVCNSISWIRGKTYTVSGTYVDTLTSATNCDSIVTLNLTVKQTTYATDNLVLCSNQLPYEYNGTQILDEGSYTITIENAVGCDSVISLTVEVNPQPAEATVTSGARCGEGVVTLQASHGTNGNTCYWYADDVTTDTLHAGNSYQPYLSANDTFYVAAVNTNTGCKSARKPVMATVNANPAEPDVTPAARCGAGAVTLNVTVEDPTLVVRWFANTAPNAQPIDTGLQFNIQNLTATSTYYAESYNSTTNCKSNRTPVTATINPIPALPVVSPITHCGPGTFTLEANNTTSCRWYETQDATTYTEGAAYSTGYLAESRSYFVSNVNATTGCESGKQELTITLYPVYEPQDLFVETCQNTQLYHYVNGQIDAYFNVNTPQTSIYTYYLKTQNNCDSTIVLHLTVNPVKDTILYVTTCQSETPYHYQNGRIDTNLNVSTTASQAIVYHFSTENGCDSTVTVNVTVNPTYAPVINRTICEGSSIFFGGEYRTTAGTYVENLQSVNGCDSVVTLNLQVSEQELVTFTEHVCYGDSYNQNGFNITNATETQTYTHSGTSVSQCDSITELHLIVHDLNTTTLYDTLCLGESFSKQGFNVTPTTVGDTVITRVVQTAYNCDSTIVLNLRVNPVYYLTDAVTTCQSETPYHYDAENVDLDVQTPGTRIIYYYHETAAGCDSNITLTLTVTPTYQTVIPLSVCQSATPYQYQNGAIDTTFDVSTPRQETIVYHFETMNQCDSIITLNLTVNPSYSKDTIVSVCDVELPYLWNNDPQYSYIASGDYPITYELATGCDSVINLHLIVHQSFEKDTNIQICEGALPYVFDEQHIFNSQGRYTVSLTSHFGCDSIYNVQLMVTPSITHTLTRNICDSELPFVYEDSTFTHAGNFTVVKTRPDGCNEITYLTLNVNPTYNTSASISICESELPYHVGDSVFNQAGVKTVHFSTSRSCDSAVTVTLTVNPVYTTDIPVTICDNELPYHFVNGQIDTSIASVSSPTTTFSFNLSSVNNCDSVVRLQLTVNPTYERDIPVTICANELPYWFINGQIDTTINDVDAQVSTFEFNLATVHNCDSLVRLNLTVNPVYSKDTTVTLCDNELPYQFVCGQIDTVFRTGTPQASSYNFILSTQNGCDSTVTLHLIVNPTYYIPEEVTIRSTEVPFLWHGMEFNESTTAYDSLKTLAGCDSVYYLDLTVTEFNVITDNPIVLCQGETETWRGKVLSEQGTYRDTVLTDNSIYIVSVTVNPTYHLTDSLEVCASELPYVWYGRRFTGDSVAVVNYQTSTFCDSTYTLVFTVKPIYNIVKDTLVCGSDAVPFTWHNHIISASGDYVDTMTTISGCDSVLTLRVHVTTESYVADSMTVCGADASYTWHGRILTETGIYSDTLRTPAGCDSLIFTMNFTKGLPFFHADTVVLQAGQSYEWRNRQITAVGTYYDSLMTTVGCDSVYSLVVTMHNYQYIESNPISLCPGDSTIWHGQIISDGGTYTDTVETGNLTLIYSVVTTINTAYYFEDTVTVCQDELPYEWHGQSVTAAGTRVLPLQTVAGCDSVYTLTLFVNPVYRIDSSMNLCADEIPYMWHGQSLSETGVYYDSLSTVNGCDSIYQLALTVNPAIRQTDSASICEGEVYTWRGHNLQTTGFYTDTVPNTYGCNDIYNLYLVVNLKSYDTVRATICLGETYSGNGFNVTPTNAGVIYDHQTLVNQNNCDSLVYLVLTVNSSYLFESSDVTCEGTPYLWHGQQCTEEGTYYDSLQTVGGCDSVFILHLTVNPSYEVYVTDSIRLHETYENYGISILPEDTGTYQYTMNYNTQYGCDSIIYLTLIVSPNIGVEDYVTPQLRIYPNPAETFVNIEGERMSKIWLYDMHGRLLQVQEADTPEFTRVYLESASTGYYVVKVQLMDGAFITKKIMVKRF